MADAQQRRQQILDTALALFHQKGYGQTSVADIIGAVGIAKGTFYHHFPSREQLLHELSAREAERFLHAIESDIHREGDAVAQINKLFDLSNQWKKMNAPMMAEILFMMHRSDNLPLRIAMQKESIARVQPLLTRLLARGQEEGVVAIEDAETVAWLVLQMGAAVGHEMGELLLKQAPDTKGHCLRLAEAYDKSVNRLLIVKGKRVRLFDSQELNNFLDKIIEILSDKRGHD
jgi:AcrR family transcriptional regulator